MTLSRKHSDQPKKQYYGSSRASEKNSYSRRDQLGGRRKGNRRQRNQLTILSRETADSSAQNTSNEPLPQMCVDEQVLPTPNSWANRMHNLVN